MTGGRTKETGVNVRSKKENRPTISTEETPKSLEERVGNLETKVANLEAALNRVPEPVPPYFDGETVPREKEKKKPGPAESISDPELFHNRDALVQWLEERWPKMVKSLLAADDAREVGVILERAARTPGLRPPWQDQFVQHSVELDDFLKNDRFTIKPPEKTILDALGHSDTNRRNRAANRLPTRQIANAMAGVPKLKWRRSLDRCSANPSSLAVGDNTARHYRAMFGIV